MHYRVESVALPRARTFRNSEMAVAFASALAKKTPQEVRVVLVSAGRGNILLFVYNKRPGG